MTQAKNYITMGSLLSLTFKMEEQEAPFDI